MIDPPTAEPQPGIYPGVPMPEYLAWPHVDNSLLGRALLDDGTVSMKHLKAFLDGKIEVTSSKDKDYGRAIHTRLLEPDKYAERHPVAGQCQAVLSSGENKGQVCVYNGSEKWDGQWYCGVHAPDGAERPDGTITSLEAALIEELVVEVQQHPAVKLLKAQGGVEVSFVWDQPVTYFVQGQERHAVIRMKGRTDKDISHPQTIPPCAVDLKKVQRGQHTDTAFARSIERWHYDTQAALYVDGLKTVDGIDRQFVWVVLEDGPPFDVNCVQADVETIEAGRKKYQKLLSLYAASLDTGLWPGGYPTIHRGGLSWWAKQQAEHEGT
jgi:hypothetical protein